MLTHRTHLEELFENIYEVFQGLEMARKAENALDCTDIILCPCVWASKVLELCPSCFLSRPSKNTC